MASKRAHTAASGSASAGRARTRSNPSIDEPIERGVAEAQRFARAWAAAYNVSVRSWAEIVRSGADMATKAARAFEDEMKRDAT